MGKRSGKSSTSQIKNEQPETCTGKAGFESWFSEGQAGIQDFFMPWVFYNSHLINYALQNINWQPH